MSVADDIDPVASQLAGAPVTYTAGWALENLLKSGHHVCIDRHGDLQVTPRDLHADTAYVLECLEREVVALIRVDGAIH